MTFWTKLFGNKRSLQSLSEEEICALLQAGKVGKQFRLVLRCYDEQSRSPAERQKTLESAYREMLSLCNDRYLGLLTDSTQVLVNSAAADIEGNSIIMSIRFARESDAVIFVQECNRILRRYGFRA